jgi:hypothetical protein
MHEAIEWMRQAAAGGRVVVGESADDGRFGFEVDPE